MNAKRIRHNKLVVVAIIYIALIPAAAYADSSWCWLTDNRPFDILPPVALATIVIEVLAIWLIPHTEKFIKTAIAVILANAASFLLPYAICLNDPVYHDFDRVLDAGPNYIVGIGFLMLTFMIEIPIVYNLLKKHVESRRKLLWTIVGSNIITTVMVAIVERVVTDGYWV